MPLPSYPLGPRGSAPAHLKNAFNEVFGGIREFTVDVENQLIDVDGEWQRWDWLYAQLWNCCEQLPSGVWDEIEQSAETPLDAPTYALMVRLRALGDDLLAASKVGDEAAFRYICEEYLSEPGVAEW